jgi:hypothetical protein
MLSCCEAKARALWIVAMSIFVTGTGNASHVRAPEVEISPFGVPWLLASWVATRVLVAVTDPDVVHLFVGDQVRQFLVAICPSPIVAWLASSVFKPTDPTLLVTRCITGPPTVAAVAGLTSGV